MRRISQFLIAGVAIGLFGCGGDGGTAQPNPEPEPQPVPIPDPRGVESYDLTSAAYLSGFLLAHENPPPECIDWCDSWEPKHDLFHLTSGSSEAFRVNRVAGGDTLAGEVLVSGDGRFATYNTYLGEHAGMFLYDVLASEVRPIAVYNRDDRVYLPRLAEGVLLWQHYDGQRDALFVGSIDGSIPVARLQSLLERSYMAWTATLTPDGSRAVWYEENEALERLFAMANVASPGTPQVLQALEPETTEYWRYGIDYVTNDALVFREMRDTTPKWTYRRLPLDEPSAVETIDIPVPEDHELGPCVFMNERFYCRSLRQVGIDFVNHLIVGGIAAPHAAVVLTDTEIELFHDIRYSPNNKWIAFAEGSPPHEENIFTMHLADLSGANPQVTTFPTSPHPSWNRYIRPAVVFSPDSTRMLFITEEGLSMVDLQTAPLSATHLLTITEDMKISHFEVLPDNAHLLLYGAKRNWIMPLTPGAMMVPLIPEPPTETWEEGQFIPTP